MLQGLLLAALIDLVFSSVAKDYGLTVCATAESELSVQPEACHKYYNCSDSTPRGGLSLLGPYEKMCPYPQLFDATELKCKTFKEANCGPNRIVFKDRCDYTHNGCGGHCIACDSMFPSCVGLKDGMNIYPLREWTPHYIQCDTERLNDTYVCSPHHPSGTSRLFSPLKSESVFLSGKCQTVKADGLQAAKGNLMVTT
ncbi:uncharacterized protein LOC106065055 [Biomphalaria glabrata]|uniref:Uncharacterized protein LOC106065055 n=1 Tax=Biomphalaria glabrata TaxID=6526 RepID=A0A9U8E9S6_BIOGL|nr:uncharacterized protein LOC106065055 [Biomphalaria glabrata]KAI8787545.1 hypothetical protein BgiBS90_012683 [Biomphalaria glabrata]